MRSVFGGNIAALPKIASSILGSGAAEAATGAAGAAAAGSGGAAAAGAGAGGAVAAGGAALASNPAGWVAAIVVGAVALAGAIAATIKSVQEMGISFLEMNRKFAESSADLAAVFNQWDRFQMVSNFSIGQALGQGGGLEFLEKQLEELSTTLMPYIAAFINLAAYILGGLVAITDFIVKVFEELMLLLAEGFDELTLGMTDLKGNVKGILADIRKKNKETALEGMILDLAGVSRRPPGPKRRGNDRGRDFAGTGGSY
jgi:hypothetical protein